MNCIKCNPSPRMILSISSSFLLFFSPCPFLFQVYFSSMFKCEIMNENFGDSTSRSSATSQRFQNRGIYATSLLNFRLHFLNKRINFFHGAPTIDCRVLSSPISAAVIWSGRSAGRSAMAIARISGEKREGRAGACFGNRTMVLHKLSHARATTT